MGVAVMQLVESGELQLDMPVGRYLDSLPGLWRMVTIRQLPTHTSGLPDIWDNTAQMIDKEDDSIAWEKVKAAPMIID